MIAKAATVSKKTTKKNQSNDKAAADAIAQQKERDMMIDEKDTYRSFWDGVKAASIIQKEKLVKNTRKTKFKRDLGPATVSTDKIYAEHSKELLEQKNLFDPEGVFKMLWDCFVGLLILYSIIIIPFRIGFQVSPSRGESMFDLIVDSLFGLDIIFNFNTSYVDPTTELVVTSRRKIAANYLKAWFWIDLFSTVPFDSIVHKYTGGGSQLESLRLIKILRLTRMLKLLRVLKLSKFGKVLDSYNINPALVGVQKLVLEICFVAHIVSCFWHFLTTDDVRDDVSPDYSNDRPNPDGNTWTTRFGYETSSLGTRYIASFYWTISTMLSIGYGDISGVNSSERIYCICTELVGAVLFGAVIAQVTRLIESRNPQARAFKEKMDELKAYLNEKLLPTKLKVAARDAYGYFLGRKSSFGETGIFTDLPPNLLNKLVLSIYSTEVHRIHLFKDCDENFIVKLVIHSKPFQAMPGTLIVEKGDVPDEIMFVMRGLVQFTTVGYTELDGVVDAVTGYSTEGGYFGDFEYYRRTIRMVSHRAMCNCSVIAIPTGVLDEAIGTYPSTGDRVTTELQQRYENFVEASQSKAHKREGHRIYVKETLVVDGRLQAMQNEGDTSKIYGKRVNSTNQVLEVYRTVREVKKGQKLVEEHAEEHYEDLIARYIILPKSDNKIKWDMFIGALILFSVLVIPVQIGFARKSKGALKIFDIVVDVFFGIDMLVSMRTCYFDDNEDAYIVVPKKMYRHYFVTWFWIDFFSVMPFERIVSRFAAGNTDIFSSFKLLKVVRLMRLLKLARLAKLRKYIARLEDQLGINPATFELVKMLLEVLFIGHLISCLYWYLSTTLSPYAWYDKLNLRNASLQEQYVTTVYWTFTTLATVGYGDIVPVDSEGRIVTIIVMILGATVFGYIVANVSSLMGSLDVTSTRMNERIAEVSEYLIEKNASAPLAESIVKHVKYMFTQTSAFDERAILSRLPLHLSRKMIFFQHADTLSKIAIFKYIQSKGVILYLFRRMTPVFYDALHYIAVEGSRAHEVVFLVSGRANVYKSRVNKEVLVRRRPSRKTMRALERSMSVDPSNKVVPIEMCDLIYQLTAGDFFGHVAIMEKRPFKASVRTFMPCSVYLLSELEITRLLRHFPAVAVNLQGALAMAINATHSFGRRHLRDKRAEFISKMGTAYVQARARMMAQKSKSSADLLGNFVSRINSKDIFDTGETKSGETRQRRRGSLSSLLGGTGDSKIRYGQLLSFESTVSKDDTDTSNPAATTSAAISRGPSQIVPLETVVSESRMNSDGDCDSQPPPASRKPSTHPPPSRSASVASHIAKSDSRWNIVRAVVHDPASMAIIQSNVSSSKSMDEDEVKSGLPKMKSNVKLKPIRKQLSSMGSVGMTRNFSRLSSTGDRKPGEVETNMSIAAVVKKQMVHKRRAKVMFLTDGNEWYDSDEDKKVYDEFYLIKSRALFKRHRSCPNFTDNKFRKKIAKKRTRRMSYPALNLEAWKEDKKSQCLL